LRKFIYIFIIKDFRMFRALEFIHTDANIQRFSAAVPSAVRHSGHRGTFATDTGSVTH
jgi:hypothetical protein